MQSVNTFVQKKTMKNIFATIFCFIAWAGMAQSDPGMQAFKAEGSFFAIYVPNLEASVKWYSENLGMRVVLEAPRTEKFGLAILEGSGFMIEIVQSEKAIPLQDAAPSLDSKTSIQGIYKIGVLVDDLEKVVSLLREKQIPIAMGPFPTRPNRRSNLAIHDNNRNVIFFIGK